MENWEAPCLWWSSIPFKSVWGCLQITQEMTGSLRISLAHHQKGVPQNNPHPNHSQGVSFGYPLADLVILPKSLLQVRVFLQGNPPPKKKGVHFKSQQKQALSKRHPPSGRSKGNVPSCERSHSKQIVGVHPRLPAEDEMAQRVRPTHSTQHGWCVTPLCKCDQNLLFKQHLVSLFKVWLLNIYIYIYILYMCRKYACIYIYILRNPGGGGRFQHSPGWEQALFQVLVLLFGVPPRPFRGCWDPKRGLEQPMALEPESDLRECHQTNLTYPPLPADFRPKAPLLSGNCRNLNPGVGLFVLTAIARP